MADTMTTSEEQFAAAVQLVEDLWRELHHEMANVHTLQQALAVLFKEVEKGPEPIRVHGKLVPRIILRRSLLDLVLQICGGESAGKWDNARLEEALSRACERKLDNTSNSNSNSYGSWQQAAGSWQQAAGSRQQAACRR